jgi:hypothetical protein
LLGVPSNLQNAFHGKFSEPDKMQRQKIIDSITDETELSSKSKQIISLTCLVLAMLLSLQSITATRFFVFKSDISIRPDLISSMIALALITPLYARNILKWSASRYGILSFVLFLSVFSSISKLAYAGAGSIPLYLISAAVALSWLGIRAIAGAVWILVFAAAVFSATSISKAMGFSGFLFIGSSFIGLLLHSDLNPSKIFHEMSMEYSGAARKASTAIAEDVYELKDKI